MQKSNSNNKRVGKYEMGKTLGEGTFGKVKHGVNVETGEEVAIKVLDKEKIQKQNMGNQIKREISIMKMVRHRFVVCMHEVLASKSKIFIVLELVTGGELFDRIVKEGRFPEEKARFYAQQLVEGVDYCHSLGICHRDLKPENLLLDENGNLKISDFGLSSLYVGDAEGDGAHRTELLHTTCGTPNYVAPEVLADKGYDGKKADCWSIGVIVYVLLAGFLPFDESTIVALFAKIQKAEFTYPSWFSEEARGLLDAILVANPTERLSLANVKDHSWMRWQEVEGAMTARRAAALEIDGVHVGSPSRVNGADESAIDEDDDDERNAAEGGGCGQLQSKKPSTSKLLGARTQSLRSNKVLNAFDLVNQIGGFALDRIIKISPVSSEVSMPLTGRQITGGYSSSTLRFTSELEPVSLLDQLAVLLVDAGFLIADGEEISNPGDEQTRHGSHITKLKATIQTPRGLIGLHAFAFVLISGLSLLEIKRGKGDILEFYSVYSSLVSPQLVQRRLVR